jgi:hypothetical protein
MLLGPEAANKALTAVNHSRYEEKVIEGHCLRDSREPVSDLFDGKPRSVSAGL